MQFRSIIEKEKTTNVNFVTNKKKPLIQEVEVLLSHPSIFLNLGQDIRIPKLTFFHHE